MRDMGRDIIGMKLEERKNSRVKKGIGVEIGITMKIITASCGIFKKISSVKV